MNGLGSHIGSHVCLALHFMMGHLVQPRFKERDLDFICCTDECQRSQDKVYNPHNNLEKEEDAVWGGPKEDVV